jgi:hypothetical protein
MLSRTLNSISSNMQVSARSYWLRYIYDKLPHGRNIVNFNKDEPWMDCPCCDLGEEDLEHLLDCDNPDQCTIRSNVHVTLGHFLHKEAPPKAVLIFIEAYVKTALSLSPITRIDRLSGWLARPTTAFLGQALGNTKITSAEYYTLIFLMPQMSLCLMEGVKLLWKNRCRIHGLRISSSAGNLDNSVSHSQDQTPLTPLTHTLIYMPPRKRVYSPDELRLLANSRNESIHGHFATQLRASNTKTTTPVDEPKPQQDEIDILLASQIDWLNPDLYTYPPKISKPVPPKPRPKSTKTRLKPLTGQPLPPLFFSPLSQPDDYTIPISNTPSRPHSENTATSYDDPKVSSPPKLHSIAK